MLLAQKGPAAPCTAVLPPELHQVALDEVEPPVGVEAAMGLEGHGEDDELRGGARSLWAVSMLRTLRATAGYMPPSGERAAS
jgi:hypothetical protein